MKITANRYHDISCGHRVVGHETKCRFLHGHNYRFHFVVEANEQSGKTDSLGRVIDFSVIKKLLAQWLEDNYDHKTLIWENDPKLKALQEVLPNSIAVVSFNPTAENIARNFVEVIAPRQLAHTSCILVECTIDETRKCSATYQL